jgi:hypothetical protein
MDSVNSLGLHNSSYNVWLAVLVNYNLPPHMEIKKGNIMLTLLIPNKYKVANIDLYLGPLLEEL